MESDWLAAAWAKIFRASPAAQMRKRDDQPRPETPDKDSEETLKSGSSTQSDDAAVEDDAKDATGDASKSDGPQAPDTGSHDDNHSGNDNPGDAASNVPEDTHDQNEIVMANPSSDLTGSAGGFACVFRKVSSYVVMKIEYAVLEARNSINAAVEKVKELGIFGVAKNIRNWVQEHPWQTALIAVPLVALACTVIGLLAVGFGPGGIAAGSTAAIIHAGIGNVVAGSLFATCTSAMMGGYGAPIIFGGVWLVTTLAVAGCAAMWKSWHSRNDRRLVRFSTTTSRTTFSATGEAASKVTFGIMLVAAYVVYRVKSWRNGRGGRGSPSGRSDRD